MPTEEPTGFEEKTLKAVILNWLYNDEDPIVWLSAHRELRKRLRKAHPKPDWARESPGYQNDATGTAGTD